MPAPQMRISLRPVHLGALMVRICVLKAVCSNLVVAQFEGEEMALDQGQRLSGHAAHLDTQVMQRAFAPRPALCTHSKAWPRKLSCRLQAATRTSGQGLGECTSVGPGAAEQSDRRRLPATSQAVVVMQPSFEGQLRLPFRTSCLPSCPQTSCPAAARGGEGQDAAQPQRLSDARCVHANSVQAPVPIHLGETRWRPPSGCAQAQQACTSWTVRRRAQPCGASESSPCEHHTTQASAHTARHCARARTFARHARQQATHNLTALSSEYEADSMPVSSRSGDTISVARQPSELVAHSRNGESESETLFFPLLRGVRPPAPTEPLGLAMLLPSRPSTPAVDAADQTRAAGRGGHMRTRGRGRAPGLMSAEARLRALDRRALSLASDNGCRGGLAALWNSLLPRDGGCGVRNGDADMSRSYSPADHSVRAARRARPSPTAIPPPPHTTRGARKKRAQHDATRRHAAAPPPLCAARHHRRLTRTRAPRPVSRSPSPARSASSPPHGAVWLV